MSLKLTDYLPAPQDLDVASVLETRQRLVAYLAALWPYLDTRPNSVYGDIYVTPSATMMTAAELAMARFKSDLNLNNVAGGKVYDPDFVRAFLENFGVSTTQSGNSSGTLKLVFNANKSYMIDSSTTFAFGDATFTINPEEGNPIMIYPTNQAGPGRRALTQTSDGRWEIYLPVVGSPDASVSDGDIATSEWTVPERIEMRAAGDFDPGYPEDSLMVLAEKAQKQFAAAGLMSRSSALSFVSARWPMVLMASCTVTGDREMIRSGTNPLGIRQGAIDVFIRSRASLAKGDASIPLTYDNDRQAWVGRLALPSVPAFFDLNAGIFQVSNFQNNRGANTVYAKSLHPQIDNLGIAYSRYECLGVAITDTNPVDFTPASISDVTARQATTVRLTVSGEYSGNIFGTSPNRSIVMRLDATGIRNSIPAISANIQDELSGEIGTVYFLVNNTGSPTAGIIDKTSVDYRRMLNGLDLSLTPTTGAFIPDAVLGLQYEFAFSGRSAHFSVNYLYEPFITQVDSVLQDPNFKPVNVEPLTRSFIIGYITQFTVNCRVIRGTALDMPGARTDLIAYLNSLTYPRLYEEAAINSIMRMHGAVAVQSVTKRAFFYPSLASIYVDKNGVEHPTGRVETTTLLPPTNDTGFGQRNVSYYIQPDSIQFNVTAH